MTTSKLPTLTALALALCGLLSSNHAAAYDASCHLDYPIVLSHHWGMKEKCADLDVEDPDDAPPECKRTAAEIAEDLPPRRTNKYLPSLQRPWAEVMWRYYSLEIVQALRDDCGNQLFLSDKPPYASLEERARSLRTTVLDALAQTGAPKVILIGMSQGVQDARFMSSVLPVSDWDASQGVMEDKVAAIVSVVGEDGGAETGSLVLDAIYAFNGGDWSSMFLPDLAQVQNLEKMYWSFPSAGWVFLSESCQSCLMTTQEDYWRAFLHSVTGLSTKYMRPSVIQEYTFTESWNDLRNYLGMAEQKWADLVPPSAEANSGIYYLNYAAAIRNGHPDWDTQTLLTWPLIEAVSGDNDGQVSVTRQRFANTASNFENISHVLKGSWGSRGYHHMWFAGRDDALLGPGPGYRADAPYDGSSAEFYEQVARDLKNRGF